MKRFPTLPPSAVLVEDLLDTPSIPCRQELAWVHRSSPTPTPTPRRERAREEEGAEAMTSLYLPCGEEAA